MSSIALIRCGEVLASAERWSPRAAGVACLEMLDEIVGRARLAEVGLFVADVGPGSFTGTRVAVILAKTLAYEYQQNVAGVSAFDLVDPRGVVVLPNRRDSVFVREPGAAPTLSEGPPEGAWSGYGPAGAAARYPSAARAAEYPGPWAPQDPMKFAPQYLVEPSISQPKPKSAKRDGARSAWD